MTVSVLDLFRDASRIMGERIGTMGTVTVGGTYTTIVLGGLINTNAGDDTAYAGDRLIFVSTTGALGEASVTTWADATGTATILNTTPAPVAAGAYILVNREDYTLNEYRLALAADLNYTPRTYRQVIPATPLLRQYPFTAFDLTGDGDVDATYVTISPLFLHNEDFSLWQNGPSLAPDGYTFTDSGTGGTITQVSGGMRSNYAARVTAGTGTVRLTQAIPGSLVQWITRRTQPVYTPLRGAAWLSTTDASSVRVFIYDGTTYHYASYAASTGVPTFPTLSLTPDASMTAFTWGVEVLTGKSTDVSFAGLMQNTTDWDTFYLGKDSGSQVYPEETTPHAVRNIGGLPYIEIAYLPTMLGQIVVYVRRPFPAYAADTDTFDNQYKRVLTAGLVNFLLEAEKPQQDRARLDRIRSEQAAIWTRLISNVVDLPVPAPPQRADVWPA